MSEIIENKSLSGGNEEKMQHAGSSSIARFLTFVSDGLTFGVNTNSVIEIINNHMIRPLPMVPDYVQGIINLRGQILPIIDMRLRMGKMFQEYTPKTCIVILDIDSTIIGLVVDAVAQVLDIDLDQTSPIPIENRQELANSMISIDGGDVVLLLECEAIISNHI